MELERPQDPMCSTQRLLRITVASVAMISACRDATSREAPQLLTAPEEGLGAGRALDGGGFLLPLGAAGAAPDAASYRNAVEELERRCLNGDRGAACFIAASTFEEGNETIPRDPARAFACYSAGCRNGATSHTTDTRRLCDAATRLGDAGRARPH